MPKLSIKKVDITESPDNEHLVIIRIDYLITDDVFTSEDFVTITV